MKILVIGLMCILWVQKASSAPKWSSASYRQPVDDLGLITDYDFMDTDKDFGNGTCFNDDDTGPPMDNDSLILDLDFGHDLVDDLGLITDYDLTDRDMDFGNGTCLNDDDTGPPMDDDSLDTDLENEKGFCFNDDGSGTVLDYGFEDVDQDLPADGLSPAKLSAWLKTVNRVIAVAGLVCLMRSLYRCCGKKAKLKEKKPKRIWKLVSKLKPVWIPSPQPMKTSERSDVTCLPRECTLPDSPHRMERDVQHSVAPSGAGMDMSPGLRTDPSGCDKTPEPVAHQSGPGYDTNWKNPSPEPKEDGAGDFPGIDPDFIRFIESFDWDTVMPQRKTSKEHDDPFEPASQEQEFEESEARAERGSHAEGDVVPSPVLPTCIEKPPVTSDHLVPDIRRKVQQTPKDPRVRLVEDDRKEARDDTPAWKSDIRKYLANLPQGILDGRNRTNGTLANEKPQPKVPGGFGKDKERHLPTKKVSFCEEVAVNRLFLGHNCPFVPKAMRKKVEIRMIRDILPLKEDGDGEAFEMLRRSNKILSLLRH